MIFDELFMSILIFPFNFLFIILLKIFIDINLRTIPIFNLIYKLFIRIYAYIQSIKYNSNISGIKFKKTHSYAGCMIYKDDRKYILQLSDIFIYRASFYDIENLIKHELAHQLYEEYRIKSSKNNNNTNTIKPHNKIWRNIFLQMGGDGNVNSKNFTRKSDCYQYICRNKLCKFYNRITMYYLKKFKKRNCNYCGSFCAIKNNTNNQIISV